MHFSLQKNSKISKYAKYWNLAAILDLCRKDVTPNKGIGGSHEFTFRTLNHQGAKI